MPQNTYSGTAKKEVSIPLAQRGVLTVKTRGQAQAKLHFNEGNPVIISSADSGNVTARAPMMDARELTIEGKDFGYEVTVREHQTSEPLDDRSVPAPAPASNYLAQVRAKVRSEMGVTRENFEQLPSRYELDEDAPYEFEEEESARLKKEAHEKAEKEKAAKAAESAKKEQSGESSEASSASAQKADGPPTGSADAPTKSD